MNMLQRLGLRLRALFRKRELDADLDEELRFHVERQMEANIQAGMSPEEARYAALKTFGWVETIKEECRDQLGFPRLDALIQDARYGARMLRKNPGFTVMAVLSLAAGIGVYTTVFSIVDAAFLRPIPLKDLDSIVIVEEPAFCYPDYLELSRQCHALLGVVAMRFESRDLRRQQNKERVQGELVSPNYFSLLGVGAAIGNVFAERDPRLRTDPVVVISYTLWKRCFNSDPAIVGKTIQLNERYFTVLGVVQKNYNGYSHPLPKVDVWLPIYSTPDAMEDREDRTFNLCGRLAQTTSPSPHHGFSLLGRPASTMSQAQAQAEVETFVRRLGLKDTGTGQPLRVRVWTDFQVNMEHMGKLAIAMLVFAGLIVLVAGINVSSMLLARNEQRQAELAVRLTLGANRWQLMRQLLVESFLLTTLASVCGLLVTAWAKNALPAAISPDFHQYVPTPQFDYRVLGFALLLTLVAPMVFGLGPAWRAAKTDLLTALKGKAAVGVRGGRRLWGRKALVVSQLAVSVCILVPGGLLLKAYLRGLTMDLGFPRKEMFYVVVSPVRSGELLERIRALPGVKQVGLAERVPLDLGGPAQKVFLPGDETLSNAEGRVIASSVIDTNFFQTMGIRILRGRSFSARDDGSGTRVVVISEGMARRYWPGQDPLGRLIRLGKVQAPPVEIVGVAADVVSNWKGESGEPFLYMPLGQHTAGHMRMLVETKGDAASISKLIYREMVSVYGMEVPFLLETQRHVVRTAFAFHSSVAQVLVGLGLLAFAMAAAGLYGLVSYSTARRTHEIGIRMALGAQTGATMRTILRQGFVLALIGLGIGLPLALLLALVIRSLLFDVNPADPITFLGGAMLVIAVALLAGYFPARRAMKIDPMKALRCE